MTARPGRNARRGALASALAAVLLATLPGVGANAAPTGAPTGPGAPRAEAAKLDKVATPTIDWWDCGQVMGQTCATVEVPLDYDEPRGDTTQIAITRLPAQVPEERVGTLFINPGGPGASATDLALLAGFYFSDDLISRYDIVGIDPRGVGASELVACFDGMRSNWAALRDRNTWFPDDKASVKTFSRASETLGKACSKHGKAMAGAVSTANVARDHELIRRAMGEKELNYLGFSYGTYLGTVYANLFPDKVGAMVLDGAVDPVAWAGTKRTAGTPPTLRRNNPAAAERVLDEALDRCAKAGEDMCVLASFGEPATVYADVRDRVRQAGSVDLGWRELTYADFVGVLLDALYSPDAAYAVDEIVSSVKLALDGDDAAAEVGDEDAVEKAQRQLAQRLALASAGRTGPKQGGRDRDNGGFPYSNTYEAFHAPACADSLDPRRVSDWKGFEKTALRSAPTFGPLVWQSAPCASSTWKVEDEDAYRGPFDATTATPVLVVGALWDGVTSYAEAEALAKTLPGSRLLTSDSWGHTAYGTSQCVVEAIDTYLLTKELPAEGTVCTGDVQPFAESPFEDGELEFTDLEEDIVDAALGRGEATEGGEGVPDHLPPVAPPVGVGAGPTAP